MMLFFHFSEISVSLFCILIASLHISNKGISYEEICNELNSQFASKTTIINILEDGVKLDFFIKTTDTHDHRKQNYQLAILSRTIIDDWLENHPFLLK